MEKACKKCRRLTTEKQCPICKNDDLSSNFKGRAVIIDPKNSQIAKELNIEIPGEYALRVK